MDFDDEKHARYVSRLGNLTLLDNSRNNDLGQAPFSRKKETFSAAGYAMTRKINYPDWTASTIEARQREMAGWAATVWQL